MENVCASQEPNCSWKFEPTTAIYVLQDGDGKTRARIAGKYLSNPKETLEPHMWASITQQVMDLWNHWQGVKNAYNND